MTELRFFSEADGAALAAKTVGERGGSSGIVLREYDVHGQHRGTPVFYKCRKLFRGGRWLLASGGFERFSL